MSGATRGILGSQPSGVQLLYNISSYLNAKFVFVLVVRQVSWWSKHFFMMLHVLRENSVAQTWRTLCWTKITVVIRLCVNSHRSQYNDYHYNWCSSSSFKPFHFVPVSISWRVASDRSFCCRYDVILRQGHTSHSKSQNVNSFYSFIYFLYHVLPITPSTSLQQQPAAPWC